MTPFPTSKLKPRSGTLISINGSEIRKWHIFLACGWKFNANNVTANRFNQLRVTKLFFEDKGECANGYHEALIEYYVQHQFQFAIFLSDVGGEFFSLIRLIIHRYALLNWDVLQIISRSLLSGEWNWLDFHVIPWNLIRDGSRYFNNFLFSTQTCKENVKW